MEREESGENLSDAKRRSRKPLKGWQRLWVATGFLYLLLIVVAGFVLMPNRRQIDKAMVTAVIEEVRKYQGLAFMGESPEKTFERAQKLGLAPWVVKVRKTYRIGKEGNAGFGRIDEMHSEAINALQHERLKLSAWLFAAWIIPMVVLYAMGALVDWISRGK